MTLRRSVVLFALVMVLDVRAAEAQCTYSVSPPSVSAPSTGFSGSISVITGSSCAWTTTSSVGWITVTSGASMFGLGSANYTVASNGTATPRTGTLTVAGQTVTITQATGSCSYSVSPPSVSAPSTGFSGSISVITGSSCAWTTTSSVGWITVTSGASMFGLGSANYSVAPNGTGMPRTGTLTVAGQTVTITQATGSCSYSVSPPSVSAPSTGFSGSISVITGSSCAWTTTSSVAWITVTSGASMFGLGSANYTVASNGTATPRTGTLTVAGQTVTITQATGSCSYSVSPPSVSAPSTGFSGSISVITGSSCGWTATSSVAWITVTSGASMFGLGSANYTVASNGTATPRTGTLTVAGQTVTITQATGSCSYSVSPPSVSAPSTGFSGSISVSTGSSCGWTATSSVAWITITSGGSMSGLGSANYTVAATTTPRTGTLTVAGQTVTITQLGSPPLPPDNLRIVVIR